MNNLEFTAIVAFASILPKICTNEEMDRAQQIPQNADRKVPQPVVA
jgi:hypothetical protein